MILENVQPKTVSLNKLKGTYIKLNRLAHRFDTRTIISLVLASRSKNTNNAFPSTDILVDIGTITCTGSSLRRGIPSLEVTATPVAMATVN
jgi:hypothetical protein